MTTLLLISLIFLSFIIALRLGLFIGANIKKDFLEQYEKHTYYKGFENGIYYTIDSYEPELFKIQIAEKSYKEYKALQNGEIKN